MKTFGPTSFFVSRKMWKKAAIRSAAPGNNHYRKKGRILMQNHRVVSRDEWTNARKELLKKEKDLTRMRDELSRSRRELPWVKVEKPYLFGSPIGSETLADLFDGRSQLIVYHFMLGPGWKEG